VIGVDMTPEMIELSRKNALESGYGNVQFRLGEIEHLPVADASVDVIISNCVINLSLDKQQVFQEAYRVLKPGGRLSISDIAATAEIPAEVKQDLAMMVGCVAGAEHVDRIKDMLENAGFKQITLRPKEQSNDMIASWAPGTQVENYVASFLIEAVK
jgi:SAM-dependent methyltransferase